MIGQGVIYIVISKLAEFQEILNILFILAKTSISTDLSDIYRNTSSSFTINQLILFIVYIFIFNRINIIVVNNIQIFIIIHFVFIIIT